MESRRAAYTREYQQRPEVEERRRERERLWRQQPEIREKLRLKAREYHGRPEIRQRHVEYLRARRLATAHLPEMKERVRAYNRKWRLSRVYGIDADEFDRMCEAQGDTCAVCRVDPIECIDHDHVEGSIRGLVCHRCNTMLGLAGDDPERLRKGAQYIESRRASR